MGALPKNKITSAERGKRRAGNTPNIKKDPKVTSVPLSKRGLVASILAATGLSPAKESKETKRRADKRAEKAVSSPQMNRNASKPSARPQSAPVKTARKTQHKG